MRKIKTFFNIKASKNVTVEAKNTNKNLNICIIFPLSVYFGANSLLLLLK